MLLNFLFAVIILKTKAGVDVFRSVADAVAGFLQFTDEGSKFVFGKKTFEDHFFAFKVIIAVAECIAGNSPLNRNSCHTVAGAADDCVLQLRNLAALLPRGHAGCDQEDCLRHAADHGHIAHRIAQLCWQHLRWPGRYPARLPI